MIVVARLAGGCGRVGRASTLAIFVWLGARVRRTRWTLLREGRMRQRGGTPSAGRVVGSSRRRQDLMHHFRGRRVVSLRPRPPCDATTWCECCARKDVTMSARSCTA